MAGALGVPYLNVTALGQAFKTLGVEASLEEEPQLKALFDVLALVEQQGPFLVSGNVPPIEDIANFLQYVSDESLDANFLRVGFGADAGEYYARTLGEAHVLANATGETKGELWLQKESLLPIKFTAATSGGLPLVGDFEAEFVLTWSEFDSVPGMPDSSKAPTSALERLLDMVTDLPYEGGIWFADYEESKRLFGFSNIDSYSAYDSLSQIDTTSFALNVFHPFNPDLEPCFLGAVPEFRRADSFGYDRWVVDRYLAWDGCFDRYILEGTFDPSLIAEKLTKLGYEQKTRDSVSYYAIPEGVYSATVDDLNVIIPLSRRRLAFLDGSLVTSRSDEPLFLVLGTREGEVASIRSNPAYLAVAREVGPLLAGKISTAEQSSLVDAPFQLFGLGVQTDGHERFMVVSLFYLDPEGASRYESETLSRLGTYVSRCSGRRLGGQLYEAPTSRVSRYSVGSVLTIKARLHPQTPSRLWWDLTRVEGVAFWHPDAAAPGGPIESQPRDLVFDGESVWVATGGCAPLGDQLLKLDQDGQILLRVPVGNAPDALAFDGQNIWVANASDDTVTKVMARDGAVLGTFAVGNVPSAILHDGQSIWVANEFDDTLTKLGPDGTTLGTFPTGGRPNALAFDGESLWVANLASSTVTKFSLDGVILDTFPVAGRPNGLAFDGQNIWISSSDDPVTALRAGDGTEVVKVTLEDRASDVIFDGEFIWVANWSCDTVTKLRASDGANLGAFPVGDAPGDLAFDGSSIWVANFDGNTVTKLNSEGAVLGTFDVAAGPEKFRVIARPTATPVPLPGNVVLVSKWGTEGKCDGQFRNPHGIAVDGSGNVYVADSFNGRLQVLTANGEFLTKWGPRGSGDRQFRNPQGIAVDGSESVYVTDKGNNRVQVLTASGEFLRKWGSQGSGDGQFNRPWGIAVDGAGNVYVADSGNHRVQVFSAGGEFLRKWGSQGSGDGQFEEPAGIAVDASGHVYVADSSNHRVQVFSAGGEFLAKWGTKGTGDGQFARPLGIAVDASGNVYVTDVWNDRVQVFSASGEFLAKWGSEGVGVAVDASGNVYVADTSNHRVQVFSLDLPGLPTPAPAPTATSTVAPAATAAPGAGTGGSSGR